MANIYVINKFLCSYLEISILDNTAKSDGWVIANLHNFGYYIVNYDETNWKLLREQLSTDHTVAILC